MKKQIEKTESANVENIINEVENNVTEMQEATLDEVIEELKEEAQAETIERINKKRSSKWNGVENYLINRFIKLAEHPRITERLLDEFIKIAQRSKDTITEREIKRLDDEIRKLEAKKNALMK